MERKYKILAKVNMNNNRSMVISKNNINGGYTMAQQVNVDNAEGNKVTQMYIKGATHINSLETLYDLRDMLNEAISKEENK